MAKSAKPRKRKPALKKPKERSEAFLDKRRMKMFDPAKEYMGIIEETRRTIQSINENVNQYNQLVWDFDKYSSDEAVKHDAEVNEIFNNIQSLAPSIDKFEEFHSNLAKALAEGTMPKSEVTFQYATRGHELALWVDAQLADPLIRITELAILKESNSVKQ